VKISEEMTRVAKCPFNASQPHFETIYNIDLKLLSLKSASLLALSTMKRVNELHTLSVHNSCMQFAMDYPRVTLKTNSEFGPKASQLSPVNRWIYCFPSAAFFLIGG